MSFFPTIPNNEWDNTEKEFADDYDKQQEHVGSDQDSLTGEKLRKIAIQQKKVNKENNNDNNNASPQPK